MAEVEFASDICLPSEGYHFIHPLFIYQDICVEDSWGRSELVRLGMYVCMGDDAPRSLLALHARIEVRQGKVFLDS